MQAAKPILKIRSVSNGVSESATYTSVPGCGVWVWSVECGVWVWCVGVGQTVVSYPHTFHLASFLGPAQLSITCSTEKRGEPGIFSHVSMTKLENGEKLQN